MGQTISVISGDGIGPEIVAQAQRVLETVAARFGHDFAFESHLMGGCAIDDCGEALPKSTLEACQALMGCLDAGETYVSAMYQLADICREIVENYVIENVLRPLQQTISIK